jgi:hypothetical protein
MFWDECNYQYGEKALSKCSGPGKPDAAEEFRKAREQEATGNEFLGLHSALCRSFIHTDNLADSEIWAGEIEGHTSMRLPVSVVFSEDFPIRDQIKSLESGGRRKH